MSRIADLTPYTERLAPVEVARLWFRRGPDYAGEFPKQYPDFPKPGPDGLYLRESVKGWFARFHGIRPAAKPDQSAEEEALRRARNGRGSHSPSSN